MPRSVRAALLTAALLAVSAPSAGAHQGNPNYRSVLHGGTPAPGVHVEVLGYDNELELVNASEEPVVIYGYDHEPYARVLANGTVQVNRRSPALYLNEDRFATTPVPPSANPKAQPEWKFQDKSGRFVWHDHRMHYMGKGTPAQVQDKGKKTKVFDYAIPIQVGSGHMDLRGTLFWIGSGSGFPVAAAVALVALALLGLLMIALVRRRRRAEPAVTAHPAEDAW